MKIESVPLSIPRNPVLQDDQNTKLSISHAGMSGQTVEFRKSGSSSETETKLSDSHIQYGKVIGASDQTQVVAKQIRDVDETMAQVGDGVKKMKSTLDDVIKVYPPYPKESSERIKALRQFSAIRKMIDQLTLPPPDDSPAKILGDDKTYPNAGPWNLDAGSDEASLTIRHQPVHAGAGGLDIPILGENSSDDELYQAATQLERAHETVVARHQNFVTDANRIIKAML